MKNVLVQTVSSSFSFVSYPSALQQIPLFSTQASSVAGNNPLAWTSSESDHIHKH